MTVKENPSRVVTGSAKCSSWTGVNSWETICSTPRSKQRNNTAHVSSTSPSPSPAKWKKFDCCVVLLLIHNHTSKLTNLCIHSIRVKGELTPLWCGRWERCRCSGCWWRGWWRGRINYTTCVVYFDFMTSESRRSGWLNGWRPPWETGK